MMMNDDMMIIDDDDDDDVHWRRYTGNNDNQLDVNRRRLLDTHIFDQLAYLHVTPPEAGINTCNMYEIIK